MPPSNPGYWGPPTATIDWCENNYEYSYYIAEMTNTVSNLMMIIPPIWGMFEVVRQGIDKNFIFCQLLLLIVGLGSWAFHMTLLYEMQLFDELPMVWGTCVLVYFLAEVETPKKNVRISNVPLFLFLLSFASLFTGLYLLWPLPLLQHTSYGLLVFSSFIQEIFLIRKRKCKVCKKLFILSTSIYLFGFFLWNIDNIFCKNLQAIRRSVPSIFDPITQLHGWWHCMAGYGTYLQVLFTVHATYDFNKVKGDKYQLVPSHYTFGLRWSEKRAE